MKSFYVVGGNCPRSRQDAQTIINYFKMNDFEPVKKISKADIICIFSCGGFDMGEFASLQTINEVMTKKNDNSTVIFTGCLTKINLDSIPVHIKDHYSVVILHFDDFSYVDKIINAKTPFTNVKDAGIIEHIPLLGESSVYKRIGNYIISNPLQLFQIFKQFIQKHDEYDERFFHIRITRGCLCNCSFCAIKFSRGNLRSSSLQTIKMEIEDGLKNGFKKFVLVGEDTGCYGLDIGTNIVELLKRIFSYQEIEKLMINDFNPQWFIKNYDQLIDIFKDHQERIEDIRIPIQSGSNRILNLMRRPYKIEDVIHRITDLKTKLPKLKIYTHIIVGFPGEKDEDFKKTIDLLQKISFHNVNVFPYEDRKGTVAYQYQDKITQKVKQERLKRLKQYISQPLKW